jgi:hypothetical protein
MKGVCQAHRPLLIRPGEVFHGQRICRSEASAPTWQPTPNPAMSGLKPPTYGIPDTGYRIPVNKIQTSAGRINKRALAKNPFIWHSFNPPKRLVNFEYLKTNKYKK